MILRQSTAANRPPGWARLIVIVSLVYGVVFAVGTISGVGTDGQRQFVSDLTPLPLGLAAFFLAWRAAARPGTDPYSRRAWRRISAAFLFWWVGDAIWFFEEIILHRQPFPSPADVAYLAFYPCLAWGLMSLASRPRTSDERTRVGLDALTVLLSGGMAVWYLVIGPTVYGHPGATLLATGLNLVYPVGDLVIFFGVIVVLLRCPGRQTALRLLLGGVALFVIADLAYARLSLSDSYSGAGWPDVFWTAAECFFVLAAYVQLSRGTATVEAGNPAGLQKVSRLPYLAIAVGYGLLAVVGRDQARYPLNGLVLGAVAITAVVVIRQIHVISDNIRLMGELHHLAATDMLTGIHNRRSFFAAAERAFERQHQLGRPLALLMLDVDHFKSVNDTFGHAAGDKVLASVAGCARTQLRERDLLGRYGGDELAIALPDCSLAGALDVADRIRRVVAASPVITEEGVVNVNLSIGVGYAEGCRDLAGLLARADSALYDAKRAGRACVRTFTPGIGTRTGSDPVDAQRHDLGRAELNLPLERL